MTFTHREKQLEMDTSIFNLIDILKSNLVNMGFFVEQWTTKKILNFQKGVIRVNCLDCLDRTNIVQTKLCLHILKKMVSAQIRV